MWTENKQISPVVWAMKVIPLIKIKRCKSIFVPTNIDSITSFVYAISIICVKQQSVFKKLTTSRPQFSTFRIYEYAEWPAVVRIWKRHAPAVSVSLSNPSCYTGISILWFSYYFSKDCSKKKNANRFQF